MKFLKPYKLFESFPTKWSDMKYDIGDILLELQDDGMDITFNNVKFSDGEINFGTYEFVISKPLASSDHPHWFMDRGEYPHNLIRWKEVKDVVKRVTRYVHSKGGRIRFFSDGFEWNSSTAAEILGLTSLVDDDSISNDEISQFNLRLLISENYGVNR